LSDLPPPPPRQDRTLRTERGDEGKKKALSAGHDWSRIILAIAIVLASVILGAAIYFPNQARVDVERCKAFIENQQIISPPDGGC
jgi:hypothetical protein